MIELLASSDDLTRSEAWKSLIAIGRPAVPFLVEALENSDYLVRWEAAKALSAIGDPTAALALVQALEDDAFEVRWRAADGLTKMGVSGLRPLLKALIEDTESVILRDGAHRVLHRVAKGELRNYLLPVLNALESRWPSLEVPVAALRAVESLEKLQEPRGKMDTASNNEFIPPTSNQPRMGLGARKRAHRYAKSLQSRTF